MRQKKFHPNSFPPWIKTMAKAGQQFIIPFTVFQAIRTIIFPTFLDILLLSLFIFITLSFYFEWI